MMKLKFIDILNDILTLDRDQLDRVIEAVKHRRDQLHLDATRNLMVGTKVKFEGRRGETLTGTISRVNIKKVKVECDNGQRWNVPAGLVFPITVKETA
jgi:hypothetical protein